MLIFYLLIFYRVSHSDLFSYSYAKDLVNILYSENGPDFGAASDGMFLNIESGNCDESLYHVFVVQFSLIPFIIVIRKPFFFFFFLTWQFDLS